MSDERINEILTDATSGVLALQGEEYPYGVPLSYYYNGKELIFHSRFIGHKVEMIRNNPKASFTIIYKDTIKPELRTTNYESVIVFGKVEEMTDVEEKKKNLLGFCSKYSPGFDETNIECSNNNVENVCVLKMSMDYVSGKFQEREK